MSDASAIAVHKWLRLRLVIGRRSRLDDANESCVGYTKESDGACKLCHPNPITKLASI